MLVEFATEKKYNSVRLHYRRVNQAERWQSGSMELGGGSWRATIPGEYTGSVYALQYYLELKEGPESATLYPGFGPDLIGQPYFVVRQRQG
jgi:hypothetical protein